MGQEIYSFAPKFIFTTWLLHVFEIHLEVSNLSATGRQETTNSDGIDS